jgi:hypothetical protein
MRVFGLAFAGGVALAVAAQAAPPEALLTRGVLASGIVQIGDRDGPDQHSAPDRATGLAGQWKGGWRRGPDRASGAWGPYAGPGVPTYWVWGPSGGTFDYPFADWRGPDGGWGNP